MIAKFEVRFLGSYVFVMNRFIVAVSGLEQCANELRGQIDAMYDVDSLKSVKLLLL